MESSSGISPRDERRKHGGSVDVPIPPKEHPPSPATFDINPSKEHLTVPERPPSLDTRRSLSTSLAVHLALVGTFLTLAEPRDRDIPASDLTTLKGEKQIDALGDAIERRVQEMQETDVHNREVLEGLESSRHELYEDLIDTLLDPSFPEYNNPLGISSTEAFVQIDTMLKVETIAKRLLKADITKKLDASELEQLAEEYKNNLLDRHEENMAILLEHDYSWTGDVRKDFPTLQQALFRGDDRYFYNPGFSETKYQKDHDQFDEQILSGVVNCQVARMTPMILREIYERSNLPTNDLVNLRAVMWEDHVFSGYEDPETHEAFTLMEGSFETPEWFGTQPLSAEDPGTLRPAMDHLAYYLLSHQPTKEQEARLEQLGYTNDASLGTFSSSERPDAIIEFKGDGGIFEKNIGGTSSIETKADKIEKDDLRKEVMSMMSDFINEISLKSEHTYPLEGEFVLLPLWLRSQKFHAFLRQNPHLILSDAYLFRALQMDGPRSRDIIDRARTYKRGQLAILNTDLHEPTEIKVRRLEIERILAVHHPLEMDVLYEFKNKSWFDSDLEFLLNDTVTWATSHLEKLVRDLQFDRAYRVASGLDALGVRFAIEHGQQTSNPYYRKAERVHEHLSSYHRQLGIEGLSMKQIQMLSVEDLARSIANDPVQIERLIYDFIDPESSQQKRKAYLFWERLTDHPKLFTDILGNEMGVNIKNTPMLRSLLFGHIEIASWAVSKHPEIREHLENEFKLSLRRFFLQESTNLTEGLDTGKDIRRQFQLLTDALALYETHPWLRRVIAEELKQLHQERPFLDFDIYYARLDRFGITASQPLPTTQIMSEDPTIIDNYNSRQKQTLWQKHKTRNLEIDRMILDAYLMSPDQETRLRILSNFYDRTELQPPVSKEQLFPEDLAIIQGVDDTNTRTQNRVQVETVNRTLARRLKSFYAPETIDLTREIRLNPHNPNLEGYKDLAKQNPDLVIQYIEQWAVFEQERITELKKRHPYYPPWRDSEPPSQEEP